MPSPSAIANAATVRAHIGALGASNREFAESLIAACERDRLSARQEHWLGVMAQRATQERPAPQSIGDLQPVIAMFDAAQARGLNRRAILLDGGADVGALRITVAGPNSRNPGSLNVTDRGAWENRRWFGRIDRSGAFHPTQRFAVPASIVESLRAFAANPHETARLYGQRTGNCMFCARELTDGRSLGAGYGPVCADKWGLPWGEGQ